MARRIVIYVAAVALLLSTAIFAISLFGASWVGSGPQPFQIHLEWGLAEMNNSESYGRRGWNALAFDWPRAWWPRSSFYYHVRERSGVVSWGVSIPLWMPVAAAGAALVPALVLERRARALAKVGRCPACGYDVAGITGPCPECGNKERERTI